MVLMEMRTQPEGAIMKQVNRSWQRRAEELLNENRLPADGAAIRASPMCWMNWIGCFWT